MQIAVFSVSSHRLPSSPSVSKCPLCTRTQADWIRTHPHGLILTCRLQRPSFQMCSYSYIPAVGSSAPFGDTIQHMTWGTVWEAARPPVGGGMSLPLLESVRVLWLFLTPPHPQPKPGLPSEAVRDHKLAFRFTSWKRNSKSFLLLKCLYEEPEERAHFFPWFTLS